MIALVHSQSDQCGIGGIPAPRITARQAIRRRVVTFRLPRSAMLTRWRAAFLIPVLALVLLALGGCFSPTAPGLDDAPLSRKWRVPSPVPAPDGRPWHFSAGGLLGEGRRLASVDPQSGGLRWAIDLPAAYAITADGGRAHSAVEDAGAVLLLGGKPGSDTGDPASMRVLAVEDGHTIWERALPPGTRVSTVGTNPSPMLVTLRCRRAGCDLSELALYDDKPAWARHIADRVGVTPSDSPDCRCVYLLGTRTITEVSAENGHILWTMARPSGAGPRLIPNLYQLTVFTPPTSPRCTATFRGVDQGKIIWTRTFRWRDAGAPAAACSYDPSRLLTAFDDLEIPVDGAIDVLDS
jgi:hypothetical protein